MCAHFNSQEMEENCFSVFPKRNSHAVLYAQEIKMKRDCVEIRAEPKSLCATDHEVFSWKTPLQSGVLGTQWSTGLTKKFI